MNKIVFATNNAHKLQELREIVGEKFTILSLNDIDCHDDIPETCPTIEGNAEQKARFIKDNYGYDCFSDDTCLEIDALGGEPGVYSARYAGAGHDSEANMRKVLEKMQGVPMFERTARFRTAVALILNGKLHIFDGRVEGHILTEKHGDSNKSFSYHLHLLQTIEQAIADSKVERFHFTLLRNLYEKTASFLGYPKWSELLPDDKQLYYSRIINFTSHSTLSNEAVAEPTPQERATVQLLLDHLKNSHGFWQQQGA